MIPKEKDIRIPLCKELQTCLNISQHRFLALGSRDATPDLSKIEEIAAENPLVRLINIGEREQCLDRFSVLIVAMKVGAKNEGVQN